MGIILFNAMQKQNSMLMELLASFRPLMGIILFNYYSSRMYIQMILL